jgi:hypothetical protein
MPGLHRALFHTAKLVTATLLLLALLVLAGCSDDEDQEARLATDTGGRLELNEIEYDFGAVPIGEMVEHSFVVRNSGDGELRLGELEIERLEGC